MLAKPPAESGDLYTTYCVRLCDGRYFPLQRNAAMSPAEQCRSFCPTAKTKIFSGNKINSAVSSDGSRYADLPTALLYRTRIIEKCTCNGRDAFGVARMDAAADPTLRAGDIVATQGGFTAFTGMRSKRASGLIPISQYPGLANETRQKLSQTKVMPTRQPVVRTPAIASDDNLTRHDNRRAQLFR